MSYFSTAYKALRELGAEQLGLFAWYRLGLHTGYLRWKTGREQKKTARYQCTALEALFELPDVDQLRAVLGRDGVENVIAEADEILDGKVRIFGKDPVRLNLEAPEALENWTTYEKKGSGLRGRGQESGAVRGEIDQDIKFLWEPFRFGWAYTLGRAYLLSGDECYPEAFWKYLDEFLKANPPNQGPQWISAQEAALRLIAMTFAAQVFAASRESTPERMASLAGAVAEHAVRIPPSLSYARSQNNNHLLSEAAGLYTAGLALPDHPQSRRWRDLGWQWFNGGLCAQIAEDGTYVQQSTNYHRLMLQLALWVNMVSKYRGQILPQGTRQRLGSATGWLLTLCDDTSGRVPNLGPNDGTYIMPLTSCPYADYRPVLQASGMAFLDERAFSPGDWDEMGVWMGVSEQGIEDRRNAIGDKESRVLPLDEGPHVLRSPAGDSWAYLRAAPLTSRPGHADQLHLDLWWRGLNIARDPGTYLYNAPPPWDNSLSHTSVHNTITVDGLEQMTRVGRFLYLDWAQGEAVRGERDQRRAWIQIVAQHDGYRRLGITHQRTVTAQDEGGWVIEDVLLPGDARVESQQSLYDCRVHWLLPDWNWEMRDTTLRVQSPRGWFTVEVTVGGGQDAVLSCIQIAHAGELVYGSGNVSPTWGWFSPTYGNKEPALSLGVVVRGDLPLVVKTIWMFPESEG